MRLILLAAASALALTACKPAPAADAAATPPAAPVPAAPADPVLNNIDLTQDIRAVGTEPFWAVEMTKAGLTFSAPDRPNATAPNTGPAMHEGEASWTGTTADGKALKVTLTAGPCSDGMSEREYPLKAKVELGGEMFKGCAATVAQLGQPVSGE
jgi:uncharacterized membrane protein